MATAEWNGKVIARSADTVIVEGHRYFPLASVDRDVLKVSVNHSVCPWKGVASYFGIGVDGRVNRDAAWSYPGPKPAASEIRGHVVFWKGVTITA